MARNKYPEETRKKILDVAEKLFLEKGYDGTSIQDIVDGLGNMTKGVIYHHFKSKFAILETIMDEADEQPVLEQLRGRNGLEKLQNILKDSFKSYRRQSIGYAVAVALRSPRILGEQYLQVFQELVPEMKKIVDEGVMDGSIQTDYPEEITELLMLTINLWIGFQLSLLSEEELRRKILFIQQMFNGLGVPLLTDEIVQDAFTLFTVLKKK
ncbi:MULTISPECIES: TetR/AcrR family transcriptional regulator [Carnobacterium]|uniref:TetR family transcriptional regulator n=1 Tax=Carnobacterium inhibens subsp. gilichinskyi TaxID=1266845 RepID=U5SF85_9LACT|nr:TetR/AcrR family transcriptional regulator [Carnobacterium inhibens]AGY82542.1 TetR family transcriptional regulator [Carnobacterium inhibens subsp. gilichinskyi]MCM3512119.1 TetR/AcrR family transcriptional regulator [Carnobacterium inhibens]